MRLCVYGLWHLGSVTAGCLAGAGFETIGLDPDATVIAKLAHGEPPLFEPGLAALIREGLEGGRLSFTQDAAQAVGAADLVWVAFDTPVDDDDNADVDAVISRVEEIFPYLRDASVVLISSQVPVGSTAKLADRFAAVSNGRRVSFAYSPENLRLGNALAAFRKPERIVVGVRDQHGRDVIAPVMARFCEQIIWTSVESAEMTKHALNAFLATCVVFTNELATLCEQVGADASEVERALRSEPRIGAKAYVRAGAAFAGGTLARDVRFLGQLAREHHVSAPLLGAVLPSNNAHRQWALNRVSDRLGALGGRTVTVLGLAYKPGTDSVRRSIGIEMCRWLSGQGASVRAHDPKVGKLPPELDAVARLFPSPAAALEGADAVVIATEWPEFKALEVATAAARMRQLVVVDPTGFLDPAFSRDRRFDYYRIGRPA